MLENSQENSRSKSNNIDQSGQITESDAESSSEYNPNKKKSQENLDQINIQNKKFDDDYEILPDFKEKADLNFKAILIGDPYVGKSSLINQSIKKKFESTYNPTLGFDYYLFSIKIKDQILKLQIWDTCGQEIYQSLIMNFYRNSSVAFMVYAINDRESFEHIENWLKEIKYKSNPDIKIFLIGNKCDLKEERKVTYEEGEECSKKFEFEGFYEVSAKTGEKAEEIMVRACQALFEDFIDYQNIKKRSKSNDKDNLLKEDTLSKDSVSKLTRNENDGKSGGKCC